MNFISSDKVSSADSFVYVGTNLCGLAINCVFVKT